MLSRNGWGVTSGLFQVSQVNAGVESVLLNCGLAIQIPPSATPKRITHLRWRVDLAPDVAAGSVIVPDKWRLGIFRGQLPGDITSFQASRNYVNEPSIPDVTALEVLHDNYLDASVSFPGLDVMSEKGWSDGGPTVDAGDWLSILLCPLNVALAQSAVGIANAFAYLEAYGTTSQASQQYGNGDSSDFKSLPRWGVGMPSRARA